MSKKSTTIGAILGFFVLGLFYSAGFKKGLISVIVLTIISYGICMVSVEAAIVVNFVGAYLGYTWAKDHNAVLEGGNVG